MNKIYINITALMLLLLASTMSSHAQIGLEDEVSDSTVVDANWSPSHKYLNIEDYDMRTMVKIVQPTYNSYNGITGGIISIESKLSPTISIEGGYIVPSRGFHTVFSRFRYYYKKGKDSKEANNLVGNHFFAGAHKSIESKKMNIFYQDIYPNELQFSVGYGYQGKVGQYGFYNALASLSYGLDRKTISGNLTVDAGYGFGIARKSVRSNVTSQLLPIIDRKRGMLKLSNVGFALSADQKAFGMGLDYEKLLWRDLTIIGSLIGSAGEYNIFLDEEERKVRFSRFSADLNFRYYYNRKKRAGRGKVDKPFNGPYFFLGVSNLYTTHDKNRFFSDSKSFDESFLKRASYRAGWGYQQRMGKHGFIDFNIGLDSNSGTTIPVTSELKFGLTF